MASQNTNPKQRDQNEKEPTDVPLIFVRLITTIICLITHYGIIRLIAGAPSLMTRPSSIMAALGIHLIFTILAFLRISFYVLTGRLPIQKGSLWIVALFTILTPITIILDMFHAPYVIVTVLHCLLAFLTTPTLQKPPKKPSAKKNSVNWAEMIKNATSPSAQPA